MAGAHRIKNAQGRWALSASEGVRLDQWISEDLASLWRQACEADPGGKKSKWIREALEALGELGMGAPTKEVRLPLEAQDQERVERLLAEWEKAFKAGDQGFDYPRRPSWDWGSANASLREVLWNRTRVEYRTFLERREAPRRHVKYAGAPVVAWVDQPGRATLFTAEVAGEMLRLAAAAGRLRKALPRALTEAKKLGFEPQDKITQSPEYENLRGGCKELIGAQAVAFDAAAEFDAATCVAVYVSQGGRKGFLNAQGRPRNNLGEAALFNDAKEALGFARKFVSHAHAVEVLASAVGFSPLLGQPEAASDLSAVIAARERRELEEALGRARIEELEEELARRKAEPADAPAKRGSSRL